MPKFKTFRIKAGAVSDDGNGSLVAYASTWTRKPDSYGDVVAKGAFAEDIAEKAETGKVVPFLWNHDSYDMGSYIGTVTSMEEDDTGLLFTASFDGTDEAQRARELVRSGRVTKFSFAYDVLDSGPVELEDGTKANELRKLRIHEISLVMYPANDDTRLVDAKDADGAEAKAGRRNSASDEETIRKAIDLLQSLLDGGDGRDDIGGQDGGEPKGGEGKAIPEGREDEVTISLAEYKQLVKNQYGGQE